MDAAGTQAGARWRQSIGPEWAIAARSEAPSMARQNSSARAFHLAAIAHYGPRDVAAWCPVSEPCAPAEMKRTVEHALRDLPDRPRKRGKAGLMHTQMSSPTASCSRGHTARALAALTSRAWKSGAPRSARRPSIQRSIASRTISASVSANLGLPKSRMGDVSRCPCEGEDKVLPLVTPGMDYCDAGQCSASRPKTVDE
jgi:hypothetical protein